MVKVDFDRWCRLTELMRWSAAVAIAIATVIAVVSIEHDSVVPMPVSITDPNSNAADPDLDALRDDHWFGAGIQRTGKCRHRQKRNKKKGKYSILHGTLFGWGHFTSRCPPECALGTSGVCIGLTTTALETPLKEREAQGQVTALCAQSAVSSFAQTPPVSLPRIRNTREIRPNNGSFPWKQS
jgi:hypothetical protein